MRQSSFFGYDFILFFATLLLIVFGILFIYSSGITTVSTEDTSIYIKQIIWAVLGIICLVSISFINHASLKNLSVYLYIFCLFLLVLTHIIGKEVHNSKSWLGIGILGIQPSEFTKIAAILFLAKYLSGKGVAIRSLKYFMVAAAIVLAPMFLILLQPDLGTSLVFVPIFLVMSFVAGAKVRHILFVLFFLFFSAYLAVIKTVVEVNHFDKKLMPDFYVFIMGSVIPNIYTIFYNFSNFIWIALSVVCVGGISLAGYLRAKNIKMKSFYYWVLFVLLLFTTAYLSSFILSKGIQNYQVQRLLIFINPYVDSQNTGYNLIHSVVAIGSGGLNGKGFLHGTQSHFSYIPEVRTDFIFAIVAEEWGFIGAGFILLLFLTVMLRGIRILSFAKDEFGVFIGTGVVSMIFFHVIVSIGMTLGIMPITGIPLFFLSYGGSSLITVCVGIGILLNIYFQRYKM